MRSNNPLPLSFYERPAEFVGPDLIGCKLIKSQPSGQLLWGVIIETEAYSQDEPACHGSRKRSPKNETLFGSAGQLYVYVSYGIHHCVNVVTDRKDWANGVLLRAIALPNEDERVAAGPALLARRFNLNKSYDSLKIYKGNNLWICPKSSSVSEQEIISTSRIGISKGKDLPWRWYLKASRSVSKRAKGDASPPRREAWRPEKEEIL